MTVLILIVLVAWLFTLFNTLLNLLLLPRLRADAAMVGPLVSVIIPARNEEENIERTVRAFLAQTYEALEVIVVDDASTDATAHILDRIASEDRRLRVISGAALPAGWLGKPWALHQGSVVASGEILIFVDADIVYAPPAIAGAVAELHRSGTAMVTLFPDMVMSSFWERVAMPQLAIVAYSFLPTWLSSRTTTVRLAIGGGTGNMMRRLDYDAVGGHEGLRDAVVDDVAIARKIRRSGRRTTVVRAEHLISVRMYAGGRAVIEGFTKNTFAVFNRSYFWTIAFAILGVAFHVMPYMLAATGSVLSLVTVGIITVTRLFLFGSLRYRLDYAVWAHPFMVLFWTWISLRSMWITGVRKQLAWRGRAYDADGTRFGA